jgi:hypothetical protein
MTPKIGDRVEFGSEVEPCAGAVAFIDHQLAIIRWDGGGECVVPLSVLEALGCGGEQREADREAVVPA